VLLGLPVWEVTQALPLTHTLVPTLTLEADSGVSESKNCHKNEAVGVSG